MGRQRWSVVVPAVLAPDLLSPLDDCHTPVLSTSKTLLPSPPRNPLMSSSLLPEHEPLVRCKCGASAVQVLPLF